ncbi:MAG: methylmalonyl-CoA mutase family protein [Desulfobacteraceae bacterium]
MGGAVQKGLGKITGRKGIRSGDLFGHSPETPLYRERRGLCPLFGNWGPGHFPYTRRNYPAGYQFMPWTNQPVIGCGTPEEDRARMDYLREQGMTG